jgi:hypothetical protein
MTATSSMQVTTSWVRDCGHLIGLFREEQPLRHAFYMFAYVDDDRVPAAMVEFYFYDEASHADPAGVQDVALSLSPFLPLDEVIHVRDARVRAPYRTSGLMSYLSGQLNMLSRSMGARYMTAASGATTAGFLSPWREEARRLGTFCAEGEERAYYLVRLGTTKPTADTSHGLLKSLPLLQHAMSA